MKKLAEWETAIYLGGGIQNDNRGFGETLTLHGGPVSKALSKVSDVLGDRVASLSGKGAAAARISERIVTAQNVECITKLIWCTGEGWYDANADADARGGNKSNSLPSKAKATLQLASGHLMAVCSVHGAMRGQDLRAFHVSSLQGRDWKDRNLMPQMYAELVCLLLNQHKRDKSSTVDLVGEPYPDPYAFCK